MSPPAGVEASIRRPRRTFRHRSLPVTEDPIYTRGLRAAWGYIDEHAGDPGLADELLRRGKTDPANSRHAAIADRAFG